MSTNNPAAELLHAFMAGLNPLVRALLDPYRQARPDAYAEFVRQGARGEMQLIASTVLSNHPAELVLRAVYADPEREPVIIATIQFEGGELVMRPDTIDLN